MLKNDGVKKRKNSNKLKMLQNGVASFLKPKKKNTKSQEVVEPHEPHV